MHHTSPPFVDPARVRHGGERMPEGSNYGCSKRNKYLQIQEKIQFICPCGTFAVLVRPLRDNNAPAELELPVPRAGLSIRKLTEAFESD
jgi:hypothetical protein